MLLRLAGGWALLGNKPKFTLHFSLKGIGFPSWKGLQMQENSGMDATEAVFAAGHVCKKGEVGRDQTPVPQGPFSREISFSILCATACHPTLAVKQSFSLHAEAELLWWGRKEAVRWLRGA